MRDGIIWKVYQEIIEQNLLEDRREYGVEDLMNSYFLNTQEAEMLNRLIQDAFDPECAVELQNIPAEIVKEYLAETIHGGMEGFEGREITVQLLINDLKRYFTAIKPFIIRVSTNPAECDHPHTCLDSRGYYCTTCGARIKKS